MEFDFNINILLGDFITKLDNRVMPQRHANSSLMREYRRNLFIVIDRMGEASSRAQGLHSVITTGRKLELSEHNLYIMKDANVNNGKGAVVGILKVGYKKLFVYDRRGIHHEVEPLCILDFYVHESRQRMGCGKQLFEFMLQDKHANPQQLAIDKPSHKFSSFLAKYYNLTSEIPQMNNFVVYDGFFSQTKDINHNYNITGRPPVYRRYTEDPYSANVTYVPGLLSAESTSPPGKVSHLSSGQISCPASENISHLNHPASENISHPTTGNCSRPATGNFIRTASEKFSRPATGNLSRQASGKLSQPVSGNLSHPVSGNLSRPASGKLSQPVSGNLSHPVSGNLSRPPSGKLNRPLSANKSPNSKNSHSNEDKAIKDLRLSPVPAMLSQTTQGLGYDQQNRHVSPPPLQLHGSLKKQTDKDTLPPLVRDGPPQSYYNLLNMHQEYQGRGGHLKVTQNTASPSIPQVPKPVSVMSTPVNEAYSKVYNPYPNTDTAWTVFGIVPNHRTIASRQNAHSRLW